MTGTTCSEARAARELTGRAPRGTYRRFIDRGTRPERRAWSARRRSARPAGHAPCALLDRLVLVDPAARAVQPEVLEDFGAAGAATSSRMLVSDEVRSYGQRRFDDADQRDSLPSAERRRMLPSEPAARLVRPHEPGYPPGLEDLPDPAPLHVLGALPAGGTALVGTRTPSSEGLAMASALAALLDGPIVAGLSPGIDLAVHRACARGRRPYDRVPGERTRRDRGRRAARDRRCDSARRRGRRQQIRAGRTGDAFRLMRRDRLQAAHTRAVELVETEATGGAMHTLRYAALLGRPRFAFAGRGDLVTSGNARAIAGGAQPLPCGTPRPRRASSSSSSARLRRGVRDRR